jgi:hypothetical protein
MTLTELLVSPQRRPFAMSASTADRDRFRAEYQRRLPPAYHDLANTDLQLFAIVRHGRVIHWHQPDAETIDQAEPGNRVSNGQRHRGTKRSLDINPGKDQSGSR